MRVRVGAAPQVQRTCSRGIELARTQQGFRQSSTPRPSASVRSGQRLAQVEDTARLFSSNSSAESVEPTWPAREMSAAACARRIRWVCLEHTPEALTQRPLTSGARTRVVEETGQPVSALPLSCTSNTASRATSTFRGGSNVGRSGVCLG